MKKTILFVAAIAALATFTSCSNDDDIVAQEPVDPVEDPVELGTPMKVFLDNSSTRAVLTKNVDNLASFKLWGIHDGARLFGGENGCVFIGNNNDGWTASGAAWPTTNKDVDTFFYGYADFSDLSGAEVPGLEPSIGASTQSFTYTLGAGTSSKLYFTQYTEAAIAAMQEADPDVAAIMQGLRDDDLNETVDAFQVADNTTMPDLIVTADGTKGTEGENGSVNLNLIHALSNLVIKARFNTSQSGTIWSEGTTYYIEWIRVFGLYTSGTYTFGTGWTFDSNNDEHVVYEKYFGEGVEHALAIPIQPWTEISSKGVAYTTLAGLGEFMMIPQTFTPWSSTGVSGTATAPDGVYLEFYGFIKKGDEISFTDSQHYLPLTVTNSELVAGRAHTLVVDLTAATNDHGVYEATPAEFNE